MENIDWPFEDRMKIIKNYQQLPTPEFNDGNEDAYRFNLWNVYDRVCQAIKSFVVLYENRRFCDAFIIAGHALECCAMLSYLKDCDTPEENRKHYEKYMASIILNNITTNLELSDNLEKDIAWYSFSFLLKLFYPFGKSILKEKKDYEDIIKKINYRKGPNKEKIGLFKNFNPVPVSEYIKALSDHLKDYDDGQFRRYYNKYCSFKHCNMMIPGVSRESETSDNVDDMLYLVLGIVTYLDIYKPKF